MIRYFAKFVHRDNSATGTRTRVARVRAEYPNQLDYSGVASRSGPVNCRRRIAVLYMVRILASLLVVQPSRA